MELFVCVPKNGQGECRIFPTIDAALRFMGGYPSDFYEIKKVEALDV